MKLIDALFRRYFKKELTEFMGLATDVKLPDIPNFLYFQFAELKSIGTANRLLSVGFLTDRDRLDIGSIIESVQLYCDSYYKSKDIKAIFKNWKNRPLLPKSIQSTTTLKTIYNVYNTEKYTQLSTTIKDKIKELDPVQKLFIKTLNIRFIPYYVEKGFGVFMNTVFYYLNRFFNLLENNQTKATLHTAKYQLIKSKWYTYRQYHYLFFFELTALLENVCHPFFEMDSLKINKESPMDFIVVMNSIYSQLESELGI